MKPFNSILAVLVLMVATITPSFGAVDTDRVQQTAEAVQQTAEAVERTTDGLEKYMETAQNVIEKYGPQAIDLGMNVLRIDAAMNLTQNAITFIVAIAFLFVGIRGLKKFKALRDQSEHYNWTDGEIALFWVHGTVPVTVGGVLGLMATYSLLNVWYWIGLIYPQAYAVYKFILQ